jgi:hypothetical protein
VSRDCRVNKRGCCRRKLYSNKVEEKGCFDKEDLELLKKVGTALLWKGATLDYMELGKKTPFSL